MTGGGLLDIMRYSTLFAFIRGCEDFYIEYQSSGQKLIPLQHGETILQHAIKNTKFSNQEVLDKCVDVQQVLSDLSKITEEFNCNELLWNLIKPLLLTNLDLINDSLEFKTGTFQLNKTNDHINLKSFLKNYEPTINNMKGNFDGLIYSLEITIND